MKFLLKGFIPLLVLIPTQKIILQKKVSRIEKGEIEIRIADCNSKKSGCKYNYDSSFSVIIKNNTDSMTSFYEDWNMWGYYNIHFEIIVHGKIEYFTKREKRGWDKNFPFYSALKPGDSMIINYTKDCSCQWSEFPCLTEKNYDSAKIKVVYQLDKETHEFHEYNGLFFRMPNDNREPLKIYQSFPTSKIESKEYDVIIKNGAIQNIK